MTLERDLQLVIESNMQEFFGVTFLAREYSTNNGGRMDSLGIDENNCPVIFEYKRSQNENVINQGLFYLDWLMSHRDSFKVLVIEKQGIEKASEIDWSMPRVICIAGDFNKYDECAINQMDKNISLIRYKKFGDELLMFEQLNQNIVKPRSANVDISYGFRGEDFKTSSKSKVDYKGFSDHFEKAGKEKQDFYKEIEDYILSLGDDVTVNQLKYYVAFKKIKNIVCIEIRNGINLYLKLNADGVDFEVGFSSDVSKKGHWGTGDVMLHIVTKEDFEKAKPLINRAYIEN